MPVFSDIQEEQENKDLEEKEKNIDTEKTKDLVGLLMMLGNSNLLKDRVPGKCPKDHALCEHTQIP